jgi:hypothetical protein
MPGIRTPPIASALFGDGSDSVKEEISYCEHCLVVGIKSKLEKRLWVFNTETKKLEPVVDPDRDRFMQCYQCGDIFPIYEVKHEPKVTDFVETTDNPFDFNSESMGVLNQTASQSIANKRNPSKRKYKHKRDQISSVKDPEIRRLLEDGAELVYEREL